MKSQDYEWCVTTLLFKSVYFSKNYKEKCTNKINPIVAALLQEAYKDLMQPCSTTAETRDCTWVIKGKCVTVQYADTQLNMKMSYRD
jgi:hypothetical protein